MVDSEMKWGFMCYIPIFNIITCVLTSVRRADSKFCRFHSRQGLVLFALWFLAVIVALISQTLSLMLWGIVLLLHGAGVFIVYKKKETKIPIIGQLAMRIPEFYIYKLLTGKNPLEQWTKEEPEKTEEEKPQNE